MIVKKLLLFLSVAFGFLLLGNKACAQSITYPATNTYTYGQSVTLTPTIAGGAASNGVVSTGTLPAGLTLAANGTITGNPTAIVTATLTVRVRIAGTNHTSNSFTITVNPAPLTITASTNNKPYGTILTNGNITSGFTVSGIQFGETVGRVAAVYGTGSASTAAIGTYTNQVTISGAGGGTFNTADYTISYAPGNIVVGLGALNITATGVSKVYGTAITGGTGSSAFTTTGLATGETVGSVTIAYGTGSATTDAVGAYANQITASAATGGTFNPANYTISYTKGTITVTGAPLTLTATGPTKIYGTALTTGTSTTNFTATAGVLGQTVTSVTLTPNAAGLSATTAAGAAYTVTPSAPTGTGGFLASNYSLTIVAYNGTVAQAPLTLTATGPLKPYGTTITAGTSTTNFTAIGAIPGQTVTSVTLTPDANGASPTTAIGSPYVITPSAPTGTGGFLASNYSITIVPYNGTVTIGNLTITATGVSKPYGNTLTGGTGYITFTTSGLATGETVGSVTVAYGTGSAATDAVGAYANQVAISAVTGGTFNPANYNISYVAGTITVTKLVITISATGPAKTYGTAFTNATYTTNFSVTSGTLAPGDAITSVFLTFNAAGQSATTAAGATYTVTPSAQVGLSAANYTISYGVFTGTVAQAPLTVTASTKNKTYGTTLTNGNIITGFTYSGQKNGNTVTGVTAAYGTGSAASAAVATYSGQITISASTGGGGFLASNYTITYLPGDIVVGQATLTITANNVTKTFGATLIGGTGSTAFTATGLAPGETVGSVTITYGTGAAAGDPVATYTNSVIPSSATGGTFNPANYNTVYVDGNITINPLPPVLSYTNPAPYTVGTAIPSLGPPTNTGGAVAAPGTYAGTTILTSTNGLNNPNGMAVDASGNQYVANFSANSIVEYSTTGTVTTYAMGSGTGPIGIVFDSSGNAYVLDQTSKQVVKFTGGNLSGTGYRAHRTWP